MNIDTSRTVVLIDGSNVEQSRSWQQLVRDHDRVQQRSRLIDAIAGWAAMGDLQIVLTFDGVGPGRSGTDRLEIIASGKRSADEILEQRASGLRGQKRLHWLATDDRQVQQVAGAGAERIFGCEQLVAMIRAGSTHVQSNDDATNISAEHDPSPSNLASQLDDSVRAKLDRLRRR